VYPPTRMGQVPVGMIPPHYGKKVSLGASSGCWARLARRQRAKYSEGDIKWPTSNPSSRGPTVRNRTFICQIFLGVFIACCQRLAGAADVTPPEKFIGHPVAADFLLDRWEKIVAYFKHVDEAADQMILQTLGQTTEG